ncbi:MAG: H4MPT-linked C1 transfer pathway protein [Methylocystis sp.]|nr:H4MPT-linked C1 transfer pathway protein [Methylocystis sp.]MBI3275821.1 H4MPT-linked C1 transfer pathway protein [Methylocystis sp.]
MTCVIGWDIGGAHLKAARVEEKRVVAATQVACTLHHGLTHLEHAITEALARLGPADRHAVTMTAELSDAFENRTLGVATVANIFSRQIKAQDIVFYAGAQGFVPCGSIGEHAAAIASANWLASASLVARHCAEALFIDMGSTTTDLVPIQNGAVAARGENDAERLANGELVYTGLVRGHPLAAVSMAPIAGCWTPLIAENFASMSDVHRILGALPDGADILPTADGRAKTIEASITRLARLTGRDASEASPAQWRDFAAFLARAQMRLIEDQIALLLSRGAIAADAPFIGAGIGRALVAKLARLEERAYRDFDEFLDVAPEARGAASDCAPAAAVALLIAEQPK